MTLQQISLALDNHIIICINNMIQIFNDLSEEAEMLIILN